MKAKRSLSRTSQPASPIVPFPAPPTESDRFADCIERARFHSCQISLWQNAVSAWGRLAEKYGDRPLMGRQLEGPLNVAWESASIDWFLNVSHFTSLDDASRWSRSAFSTLQARFHHLGFLVQFIILDTADYPIPRGAERLLPGNVLLASESVPESWLFERHRQSLTWGDFTTQFAFLVDDRPLRTDEKAMLSKLAIRFVMQQPGGGSAVESFRHAVGIAWGMMRNFDPSMRPPTVPPRPKLDGVIGWEVVWDAFDSFDNWLREFQDRRESSRPKPPVDVNVVNRVDARVVDATTEIEERFRAKSARVQTAKSRKRGGQLLPEDERQRKVKVYANYKASRSTQSEFIRNHGFFNMDKEDALLFLDQCRKAWEKEMKRSGK